MRYVIDCEATISGDITSVWQTWTDMPSFPDWDPREEVMRLDGPFAVGTTGWSKQRGGRGGSAFVLKIVEPQQRWANEIALPGGHLTIDHTLTPVGVDKVHIVKRYCVDGPMAIAFRLVFAREIRAHTPQTLTALETEVARRRQQATGARPGPNP